MRTMKMLRFSILLTLLLLPLIGADCNDKEQKEDWPQKLPTTQLTINGNVFTLEIADDDKEREIGLMKRDSMAQDHGMIFIFPDESPRAFWMKNTRIDLDIFYVRADGSLDSAATMRAYDVTGCPSKGPAKYAIELNAGWIDKLKLKAGDKLELPASPDPSP